MHKHEAIRIRKILIQASQSLSDEIAINIPEFFKSWKPNISYAFGDRCRYNNILYKCIQAHQSQVDWTPDISVSLWTHISVEEYPQWMQPTGAQDAYMKGDKVTYNDNHYISDVDNNVWSPEIYGWTKQ